MAGSHHRFRARLAAALVAGLALAAVFAGAQEGNAKTEERLEALERQVEALRAELREARAAAEPAGRAGAADESAGARLDELERRIERIASELETMRLGEAAVEADESRHGLGPAASKVYRQAKGVSIGGYGEMLYQGPSGTRDDGSASGRADELDFLRAVVYFGYKWNDQWLFNSELEWEHADVESGGDAAVEFAYVDRLIRPEVNARAGLLLVPMGLVNELHEPTVYLGARRPGVESAILPTTWRENGLGVFGELGPVSYRSYVVNGLDAEGFRAAGLRGGRQKGSKAKAEDLAWVTRVDWTALPGLLAGGSVYLGGSGQGIAGADGRELGVDTTIVEAHVDWQWRGLQLRGLWAQAELDDVAALNGALGLTGSASVGERLSGSYLEAGYDVGRHLFAGGDALVPFARFERYDTQERVPAGFLTNPANDVEILTLGLSWKPLEQLVVKADWQDVDNAAGTGVDQFNLGLGYVF
ncbi:MAG TPA: hypothetical protein VLA66_09755 [Thermoanaerobaculia bacterium]|nr:hypothetical protein [Thermoanaerobaculia bacterium]